MNMYIMSFPQTSREQIFVVRTNASN